MTYKSLDRSIIELSSVYHNLPNNTIARTGRSRKASTTFSTSGSDVTPRKRRYVVDLTVVSDGDDYDDEDDEDGKKQQSDSASDSSS